MTDLIIVGAGGFGRETVEVVRALNAGGELYRLVGLVDDAPALHGLHLLGVPVLGPVESVLDYPDTRLVITTGHPGDYFSRKRIVDRLGLPDDRFESLVHPSAVVPSSASVGAGSVVHAGVVLTADVVVGRHVVVMPGVTLTHDDRIGDFVTFGAGARMAGRVSVHTGAYVGSGALVREDRSVGAWSLVGMGSVVTRDIPEAEVWAGVPARFMRAVDLPADIGSKS